MSTPRGMAMRWRDLPFTHPRIDVDRLHPQVLSWSGIDTGTIRAWLAMVPFRMTGSINPR